MTQGAIVDTDFSCSKHPDRPGVYYCAKYNRYLCAECLTCQDPSLYCKHRTGCVIHELERHPEEIAAEASENL